MPEKLFVQLIFVKDSKYGEFTDMLNFPYEEYQKLDRKLIDQLIDQRTLGFEYNVENPPVPREITKEEILESIQNLADQKIELQTLLVEEYEPTKEELQKIVDNLDDQKEIIQSKIDEIDINE